MKIIYISGLDGCGKTTQAKLVVEKLNKNGIAAEYLWLRWEPSIKKIIGLFKPSKQTGSINKSDLIEHEILQENKWASAKQKVLSIKVIRKIWLFYAFKDYSFSCQKKLRSYNKSKVIIADRYIHDLIIDQAVNLGVSPDMANSFVNPDRYKLQFPNLNIIIDISAETGYQRKMDGTSLSCLEKREPFYKDYFSANNSIHFNGLEGIEALSDKIFDCVNSYLRRR